ncbi:MAG: hypothetical protein HY738_06930 [Bacteroidia bacterium]|nr:hypothetical protein [Bacteroidia bacterium]
MKGIEYYYNNTTIVYQEETKYIQDSVEINGVHMICSFEDNVYEKFINISHSYIFKYKNNFIKYRITYPEMFESCSQSAINDFFRNFKWITE